VLCEHGGWGGDAAAPLAAQVINAFVTKQRAREGNILRLTNASKPATVASAGLAGTNAHP